MRKYTVGINVTSTDELERMGAHLRSFFDEIGQESEIDVQISVNPLLAEPVHTHAIGFVAPSEPEYYEEGDDE